MDESYEQRNQLRALAMRVAALEDNVAFLEEWCEEQQDALDRVVGPASYNYDVETDHGPPPPTLLRIVDLRDVVGAVDDEDDVEAGAIVALVETEHERRVRQLHRQLNRLRARLAQTLAPPGEELPTRRVSAKQAGRTAP